MTVAAFGKYQVVQKIGEGGFGEVYEGLDSLLNRRVAIKTCSSRDETLRRRFAREAEIAANLRHPNIVTIFDFGHEDDTPYLVQEYLSGEDLDHKIKRRERLGETVVREYLLQIASGLQYAHSREVVHRDVKPANIRILDDGQVRIMDFGIAKLLSAQTQLTRTGMALGTAAYLPPEQILGQEVDPRADQFSFGVLAYELISGERPFSGDSMSTILYAIAHKEPAPLSRHCPHCPPRLATLIDTCLAKDPADRYPGFGEIIAELQSLTLATTVLPVPPPPPVPGVSDTQKTIVSRRGQGAESRPAPSGGGRKLVIGLLIAGLLLVLGLGIVTFGKLRSGARQAASKPPPAVEQPAPRAEIEPGTEALEAVGETGSEVSGSSPPAEVAGPDDDPVAEARPPRRRPPPPRTAPPQPKPEPKPELESFSEPAPSEQPEAEAEPPADEALLAAIPFGLEQGRLAPGQRAYADRDFVYQDVPGAYRDLPCLRTLNAFKRVDTGIELTVGRDAEVFVAHDRRIRRKPPWLGSFRSTGETLTVREGTGKQDVAVYDVYVREYPRGTVHLGPNTPPRAKKRVSMYTAFVRPLE